jgi:hypothetical protein
MRPLETNGASASADLWQARNGSASAPVNPVDWVKGNLGSANSHYSEGHSIPYRLVLTRLAPGPHNVVIEWDTRQSGTHAIDYITHYDRLLPHDEFRSHSIAEAVDPIAGLAGAFGPPGTYPIPAPTPIGTPVPGLPAASFEALPPALRAMTIWNGSITSLTYLQQESLSADTAATRLSIDFVATSPTVVIAWGGHIASRVDWGIGNSATSISGSPFHTRLVSFDGAGGNQDRSVRSDSIFCGISGPAELCGGATGTFLALEAGTNSGALISWTLTNNTAGAVIVGPADAPSVQVRAAAAGMFGLKLRVVVGDLAANCVSNVTVLAPPTLTCPADIIDSEFPRGSGLAVVAYPPPVVVDECDPAPQVTCLPPAGAVFPVGTTTVTCTLDDRVGNHLECTFTVRVIPYLLLATNLADSGAGTLRQALMDANDGPGPNKVQFLLPGEPPYTIHLLSPLPPLADTVTLDGTSQPGFVLSPVVELDGASPPAGFVPAGATTGLVLVSPGNVVRGLVLNGFDVGIRVADAGGNVIEGNIIGPDSTGTNAVGNSADGILLEGPGASGNLIRSNLIAFNGRNGIALALTAGSGNTIRANSIFENGGLGIDLGADGPTANDPTDSETGPNGLQNFPILADARSADGVTTIEGALDSISDLEYRLDFYLNDATDPSGFGEGATYLGSTTVTPRGGASQNFSLSLPITTTFEQFVTATATDPGGSTSEFSPAVPVRTPPILKSQPIGTNVPPGQPVTLCVSASGTPPLLYQWRLNGQNIPGATDSCYIIPAAQTADGGAYSVVVGNVLNAVQTGQAPLTLPLTNIAAGDNFADRVLIEGTNGLIAWRNLFASREPDEPNHAGKPGGKSVWYRWIAPVTGVATVGTRGSTFDTMLAVYEGMALSNLESVAFDEDRGGYFTSGVRFNALKDHEYEIAIDGFGGTSGEFIFGWSHEDSVKLLPVIRTQPQGRTVAPGGTASFSVEAVRFCSGGHPGCPDPAHFPGGEIPQVTYQWTFNGVTIPGEVLETLTISNVQPENLGTYTVLVSTPYRTIESVDVRLQINLTGQLVEPVQAMDKFLDAALAPVQLRLGNAGGGFFAGADGGFQPASIARGYTGTQVFNTSGSTTEGGEEPICGVLGGASEWITFVAEEAGQLFVNTDGSSYDTVLAIFRRNPANPALLQELACDNNGGLDHRDSSTNLFVQAGQTNFIVVDGVNGASGTLRLNYSLVPSSSLRSLGFTPQRAHKLQLSTHAGAHFSIQTSTTLTNWTTIFTTNTPVSLFDFIDSGSINAPRRFYRALMLP